MNFTNYSRPYIEFLAESIAVKLDFNPGDSLEPIIERLGGVLKTVYDRSQYIKVNGKSCDPVFEIGIAWYTSVLRDRVCIAHELGHYF